MPRPCPVTDTRAPPLRHGIAALASIIASSCATVPDTQAPSDTEPGYGESRATAIEVCRVDGQRAYLARLVCPGGEAATYDHIGNAGPRNDLPADKPLSEQVSSARRDPLPPGEVDYHVVDVYAFACGASTANLYLDMYHCHQQGPTRAPPGYTLK